MSISKQLPLLQKTNTYIWRGISADGGQAAASIPVCTNGYFEVSTEALDKTRKFAFCKRPGVLDLEYVTGLTNLKTTNSGERIKGLCSSLDKNQVLFETQDATKRYSNIFTASTNTLTQTDISANFPAEFYAMSVLDGVNYGSNVYYAAMSVETGIGALINSSGVWSKITDADFTGNGVKTNFVGLDGYLFYGVISGTGAGRIYNSDLSAAAAASGWTSTSFVSANDIPGNLVWLSRIRNMIVCFKQYSIEFFEDTGNPTPGSPLTPRRNLIKHVGCVSASSIQEVSDGIIFAGINKLGKMKYYKLLRDSLELKDISDAQLEATLNTALGSIAGFRSWSGDWEVTSATSATFRGQSQVINYQDKELYTTIIPSNVIDTPLTYVYDNDLEVWGHWSTSFGGESSMDGTFIPAMSFLLNIGNSSYTTCFINNYTANTKSRFSTFVPVDSIYSFKDMSYYSGSGDPDATYSNNFVFSWQSDFFDFETGDRKFLHLIEVFYDSNPNDTSSSNTTFNLTLFHYDKDYNNSVGGTRNCLIDSAGHRRAVFRKLGSFRRKAFKLLDYSNYPLRIWGIEVVYSGGPQYA